MRSDWSDLTLEGIVEIEDGGTFVMERYCSEVVPRRPCLSDRFRDVHQQRLSRRYSSFRI
jgi:hypothetical protein